MIDLGPEQLGLLAALSSARGVSGAEGAVRDLILTALSGLDVNTRVDPMGNLLVTGINEGQGGARVLVAAHMDEVGMMLTSGNGEGIFRFAAVGGLRAVNLVGQAVAVGEQGFPGVIGCGPVHLVKGKKRRQPGSIDDLRIDVGPEIGERVKVGDYAVFRTQFFRQGEALFGKAFDDRLGAAILVELIKHPPRGVELTAAFTVQEEVGLRGAKVAAHALDPDVAFALDTTPARDFPPLVGDEEAIHYNAHLDQGPVIYAADGATISDTRLVSHLVSTALKAGLPHQIRQPGGGGTDAGAMFRAREGIPSVSVSVPTRYLHTAVSQARISDWAATVNLMIQALDTLPGGLLEGMP